MSKPMQRALKNKLKKYSVAQVKVREATSNDASTPDVRLLCEISDLTYNHLAFADIMQMIWKRLGDSGKYWRHVLKSLLLLEHLLRAGTAKVADQCRDNIGVLESLKRFQYQEGRVDHGARVRELVTQLIELLFDEIRLANERTKAMRARERMLQERTNSVAYDENKRMDAERSSVVENAASASHHTAKTADAPATLSSAMPQSADEEQRQLELALRLSESEFKQANQSLSGPSSARSPLDAGRRSYTLGGRGQQAPISHDALRLRMNGWAPTDGPFGDASLTSLDSPTSNSLRASDRSLSHSRPTSSFGGGSLRQSAGLLKQQSLASPFPKRRRTPLHSTSEQMSTHDESIAEDDPWNENAQPSICSSHQEQDAWAAFENVSESATDSENRVSAFGDSFASVFPPTTQSATAAPWPSEPQSATKRAPSTQSRDQVVPSEEESMSRSSSAAHPDDVTERLQGSRSPTTDGRLSGVAPFESSSGGGSAVFDNFDRQSFRRSSSRGTSRAPTASPSPLPSASSANINNPPPADAFAPNFDDAFSPQSQADDVSSGFTEQDSSNHNFTSQISFDDDFSSLPAHLAAANAVPKDATRGAGLAHTPPGRTGRKRCAPVAEGRTPTRANDSMSDVSTPIDSLPESLRFSIKPVDPTDTPANNPESLPLKGVVDAITASDPVFEADFSAFDSSVHNTDENTATAIGSSDQTVPTVASVPHGSVSEASTSSSKRNSFVSGTAKSSVKKRGEALARVSVSASEEHSSGDSPQLRTPSTASGTLEVSFAATFDFRHRSSRKQRDLSVRRRASGGSRSRDCRSRDRLAVLHRAASSGSDEARKDIRQLFDQSFWESPIRWPSLDELGTARLSPAGSQTSLASLPNVCSGASAFDLPSFSHDTKESVAAVEARTDATSDEDEDEVMSQVPVAPLPVAPPTPRSPRPTPSPRATGTLPDDADSLKSNEPVDRLRHMSQRSLSSSRTPPPVPRRSRNSSQASESLNTSHGATASSLSVQPVVSEEQSPSIQNRSSPVSSVKNDVFTSGRLDEPSSRYTSNRSFPSRPSFSDADCSNTSFRSSRSSNVTAGSAFERTDSVSTGDRASNVRSVSDASIADSYEDSPRSPIKLNIRLPTVTENLQRKGSYSKKSISEFDTSFGSSNKSGLASPISKPPSRRRRSMRNSAHQSPLTSSCSSSQSQHTTPQSSGPVLNVDLAPTSVSTNPVWAVAQPSQVITSPVSGFADFGDSAVSASVDEAPRFVADFDDAFGGSLLAQQPTRADSSQFDSAFAPSSQSADSTSETRPFSEPFSNVGASSAFDSSSFAAFGKAVPSPGEEADTGLDPQKKRSWTAQTDTSLNGYLSSIAGSERGRADSSFIDNSLLAPPSAATDEGKSDDENLRVEREQNTSPWKPDEGAAGWSPKAFHGTVATSSADDFFSASANTDDPFAGEDPFASEDFFQVNPDDPSVQELGGAFDHEKSPFSDFSQIIDPDALLRASLPPPPSDDDLLVPDSVDIRFSNEVFAIDTPSSGENTSTRLSKVSSGANLDSVSKTSSDMESIDQKLGESDSEFFQNPSVADNLDETAETLHPNDTLNDFLDKQKVTSPTTADEILTADDTFCFPVDVTPTLSPKSSQITPVAVKSPREALRVDSMVGVQQFVFDSALPRLETPESPTPVPAAVKSVTVDESGLTGELWAVKGHGSAQLKGTVRPPAFLLDAVGESSTDDDVILANPAATTDDNNSNGAIEHIPKELFEPTQVSCDAGALSTDEANLDRHATFVLTGTESTLPCHPANESTTDIELQPTDLPNISAALNSVTSPIQFIDEDDDDDGDSSDASDILHTSSDTRLQNAAAAVPTVRRADLVESLGEDVDAAVSDGVLEAAAGCSRNDDVLPPTEDELAPSDTSRSEKLTDIAALEEASAEAPLSIDVGLEVSSVGGSKEAEEGVETAALAPPASEMKRSPSPDTIRKLESLRDSLDALRLKGASGGSVSASVLPASRGWDDKAGATADDTEESKPNPLVHHQLAERKPRASTEDILFRPESEEEAALNKEVAFLANRNRSKSLVSMRTKSPADFLGNEFVNLVDFDNLCSSAKEASKQFNKTGSFDSTTDEEAGTKTGSPAGASASNITTPVNPSSSGSASLTQSTISSAPSSELPLGPSSMTVSVSSAAQLDFYSLPVAPPPVPESSPPSSPPSSARPFSRADVVRQSVSREKPSLPPRSASSLAKCLMGGAPPPIPPRRQAPSIPERKTSTSLAPVSVQRPVASPFRATTAQNTPTLSRPFVSSQSMSASAGPWDFSTKSDSDSGSFSATPSSMHDSFLAFNNQQPPLITTSKASIDPFDPYAMDEPIYGNLDAIASFSTSQPNSGSHIMNQNFLTAQPSDNSSALDAFSLGSSGPQSRRVNDPLEALSTSSSQTLPSSLKANNNTKFMVAPPPPSVPERSRAKPGGGVGSPAQVFTSSGSPALKSPPGPKVPERSSASTKRPSASNDLWALFG